MLPNNNAKITEETRKIRPFSKQNLRAQRDRQVPAAINANKIFCPNSLLRGKYYPIKATGINESPTTKIIVPPTIGGTNLVIKRLKIPVKSLI